MNKRAVSLRRRTGHVNTGGKWCVVGGGGGGGGGKTR